MKQIAPAYPIFVKDPNFSFWLAGEKFNEMDTVFWSGDYKKCIYGLLRASGRTFCFLGNFDKAEKLEQKEIYMTAFSTVTVFENELFELKVEYISPLPLDDLNVLSMPVCYATYCITPKCELTDVSVCLLMHENTVYHVPPQVDDVVVVAEEAPDDKELFYKGRGTVKGGVVKVGAKQVAYFGRRQQLYLSNSSDRVAPDWGYMYLYGEEGLFFSQKAVEDFVSTGEFTYALEDDETCYIAARNTYGSISGKTTGRISVAFDDVVSIYYFGQFLSGYYFNDGKNIFDALIESDERYDEIISSLTSFDSKMQENAREFGDEYLNVLYASLRQTIAGHKLVQNRKGELLFLSKECGSNGCIATVDVTYPSAPLFLLYAPELLKGMMTPIFEFAKNKTWKYNFAPHDAGSYPFCLGQTYGLREYCSYLEASKRDKFMATSTMKSSSELANHPLYHTFPAGNELYQEERQMPLEESANMLIVSSALFLCCDDKSVLEERRDLLNTWADYLVESELIPFKQLTTDDFIGMVEKSLNLAIKVSVALSAYSKSLVGLGVLSADNKYLKKAKEISELIQNKYGNSKHLPMSYDGDENSYSLKYNLAFDSLLNLGLYSQEMKEKEIDKYLKEVKTFGAPLDSRVSFTKSDWIVWCAALTEYPEKRNQLIKTVDNFLKNTNSRVPFGDWYETENGKIHFFRNRTVQGAMFILLLKKALTKN
jgi:hypothetical protein